MNSDESEDIETETFRRAFVDFKEPSRNCVKDCDPKMEQFPQNEDEKYKYFPDYEKENQYCHAVGPSNVKLLLPKSDNSKSPVQYVKKQCLQTNHNQKYKLEIFVNDIELKKHELISIEHESNFELINSYTVYEQRLKSQISDWWRCTLNGLKSSELDLMQIIEASRCDMNKAEIDGLLTRAQMYREKIRQSRKMLDEELKKDRDLFIDVIKKWESLQHIRKITGFTLTDSKLYIIKQDRKRIVDDLNAEISEEFRELKTMSDEISKIKIVEYWTEMDRIQKLREMKAEARMRLENRIVDHDDLRLLNEPDVKMPAAPIYIDDDAQWNQLKLKYMETRQLGFRLKLRFNGDTNNGGNLTASDSLRLEHNAKATYSIALFLNDNELSESESANFIDVYLDDMASMENDDFHLIPKDCIKVGDQDGVDRVIKFYKHQETDLIKTQLSDHVNVEESPITETKNEYDEMMRKRKVKAITMKPSNLLEIRNEAINFLNQIASLKRPLKPRRKPKLSNQEDFPRIIVQVVSAIGLFKQQTDQRRSFVEVSYAECSACTNISIGCDPSWNDEFCFKLKQTLDYKDALQFDIYEDKTEDNQKEWLGYVAIPISSLFTLGKARYEVNSRFIISNKSPIFLHVLAVLYPPNKMPLSSPYQPFNLNLNDEPSWVLSKAIKWMTNAVQQFNIRSSPLVLHYPSERFILLCRLIEPIDIPNDLITGDDLSVRASESVAKFVSLIPSFHTVFIGQICADSKTTISRRYGDELDLSIVLNNMLLSIGRRAWILIGSSLAKGRCAHVLTIERINNRMAFGVWNHRTGKWFPSSNFINDTVGVDFAINEHNVWLNVQSLRTASRMGFEFDNRSQWIPLFGKGENIPGIEKLIGANIPETYYSIIDAETAIATKIEEDTKDAIARWRGQNETNFSIQYRNEILAMLEKHEDQRISNDKTSTDLKLSIEIVVLHVGSYNRDDFLRQLRKVLYPYMDRFQMFTIVSMVRCYSSFNFESAWLGCGMTKGKE
ncbi:hypothetical protein ACOME3_000651 [Neoechinorhynchus agilis]